MTKKLETSSTSRRARSSGGKSRGAAAASGKSRGAAPASVPSAWIRFLRAHAAITARMDATLREEHGISLREYEVLLVLFEAPDRRLRRVDLAAKVLLTQSGVTRLLEPLERRGLVGRTPSPDDRRVTFATLTAQGAGVLRAAAKRHRTDIHDLFAAHYTDRELAILDRLLQRLPGGAGEGAWGDA